MRAPEQRQAIVDLCLALSRSGHFSGTGGNVALRIDAGHFLVTPSATDYFAMIAADVCLVRFDGLLRVEGERAPSVETALHAQVLRRRADVNCSIHTHQPLASALALAGDALRVADADARAILGDRLPMVGYMPSGTAPLAAMVGRAIRADANAYLMRNHGVLCCGRDIAGALRVVNAVEDLARARLHERIVARMMVQPERADALRRVLETLDSMGAHSRRP